MPNPNPPSPPPVSQSHSTCPDDSSTATIAWPPAAEGDDDQTMQDVRTGADEVPADGPALGHDALSPPPAVSPPLSGTVTITESIVGDEVRDDDQSLATSRSVTMSPGPGSALVSVSRSTTADPNLETMKQMGDAGFEEARQSISDSRLDIGESLSRRSVRTSREGRSSVMTDSDKSLDFAMMDWDDDQSALSMGIDYPNMRVLSTSPSSFLRAGSRFHGTQQSERQVYEVQVEIKYVDLRESFLCGYLRIQGLTEDHPTLTTYFEGEIIGTKYHFITNHESWGASDSVDMHHWSKFNAFRPFHRMARKGPVLIRDVAQRENIFMRWKEHFLVPDHRVRTISGASFEGFYYICFNQKRGEVSGIYFHSKSERFQQLELKHVEDRGCFGAMEFR